MPVTLRTTLSLDEGAAAIAAQYGESRNISAVVSSQRWQTLGNLSVAVKPFEERFVGHQLESTLGAIVLATHWL